jgi:hypothetical protein
MMGDYFKQQKIRYWQHVPSLVQHAEGISLINPRRSGKRTSPTFKE